MKKNADFSRFFSGLSKVVKYNRFNRHSRWPAIRRLWKTVVASSAALLFLKQNCRKDE
jgi:hypothetical protein